MEQSCYVCPDLSFVSIRRNLAATFRTHILNSREVDNIANLTPVRVLGSCSFMYMRHGDVYILGVTKSNANVMMAFQFMTNVSAISSQATVTCALVRLMGFVMMCIISALLMELSNMEGRFLLTMHVPCRLSRCARRTLVGSAASRA